MNEKLNDNNDNDQRTVMRISTMYTNDSHNLNQEFENRLFDVDRILDIDPDEKRTKNGPLLTCGMTHYYVRLKSYDRLSTKLEQKVK